MPTIGAELEPSNIIQKLYLGFKPIFSHRKMLTLSVISCHQFPSQNLKRLEM